MSSFAIDVPQRPQPLLPVQRSTIRHSGPISGIDAGGQLVATAGYDNKVIVWDARSRTAIAAAAHDHLANHCRFSHDGRLLVTSSSDYTARLWRAADLRLLAVFDGHDDDVEMSAFSPDDRHVATASRDRRVRVFDVTGRLVATLSGHEDDALSVEWVGDDMLLSCSDDGTVRTWSVSEQKLLSTVSTGEFQADTVVAGTDAYYAGNDAGDIVIVDPASGTARGVIHAHGSGIKRLSIHRESNLLSSTSYDRLMKVWRPVNGSLENISATEMPSAIWPRSTAWLDPTTIVCGTFGTSYAAYDIANDRWNLDDIAATGGLNAVLPHNGSIYSVGDSGIVYCDGVPISRVESLCNFLCVWDDLIVTGGQNGCVYDARRGSVLVAHRVPLNYAAVCGERLLVATYGGELLVLGRRNGAVVLETVVQAHKHAVKSVICNGRRIFSVAADTSAAFRDAETLELVAEFKHAHRKIANGAAALPDGRFASVSRDGVLRLWTESGATEIATPHQHSIKCVAVSRDGGSIAAGAYDGRVAVYDLASENWRVVRMTTAGISAIAAFNDGFVASSYDGNTYQINV